MVLCKMEILTAEQDDLAVLAHQHVPRVGERKERHVPLNPLEDGVKKRHVHDKPLGSLAFGIAGFPNAETSVFNHEITELLLGTTSTGDCNVGLDQKQCKEPTIEE